MFFLFLQTKLKGNQIKGNIYSLRLSCGHNKGVAGARLTRPREVSGQPGRHEAPATETISWVTRVVCCPHLTHLRLALHKP